MKNAPLRPPPALLQVVAQECAAPTPEIYRAIPPEIQKDHGDALFGILLYGSCLWSDDLENNIADVCVIVDDYKKAYKKRWLAMLNGWLPPNVFYREFSGTAGRGRIKAAVFSLEDFQNGVSNWFHSYLWGRFAQPVRLLYARDAAARRALREALAQAALTLLKAAAPTLEQERNEVETIWTRALSLSYSAEYRPEGPARPQRLARLNLESYARLTAAAAPALGDLLQHQDGERYRCIHDDPTRRRAWRAWALRRRQGRVLSVLRLMKAAMTFDGGVDYAAWKISRHTGATIEITPALRRHPLLFGWRVFRRLVKRKILH